MVELTLHLCALIAFHKDSNVEFRHITYGKTAAEQEDIFHCVHHPASAVLYDTFMEQRFADVAAKEGNTSDCQRSHQENCFQQRLLFSKAPNVIEIQRVCIHKDYTSSHKKNKLNHGMVNHVKDCSVYGQGILFAEQPLHAHTDKNESNLRHG